MDFFEKIQRINTKALYGLLIVATTLPLFAKGCVVPTLTTPESQQLYINLNKLEEGDVVAIETDWTNSSRGESSGQLEALLRILKSKKVKFVMFSAADPQAPQVARNVIDRFNKEVGEENGFKLGEDWLDLQYFPQAESYGTSLANDLVQTWKVRRHNGGDIFKTPVLQNIRKLEDLSMYIIVTASGTPKIFIQRFGAPSKVPIAAMVTGVMGPEHQNYFNSKQLVGLSIGLRGVVELETMMANGVNHGPKPFVSVPSFNGQIPPMQGVTYARGMNYFASLHTALTLLLLVVFLGNLGMLARRKKGAN